MNTIWQVIRHIPAYKQRVVSVALVSVAAALVAAATPYLYTLLVDRLVLFWQQQLTYSELEQWLLGLIGVAVLLRLATVVFNATQEWQADQLWLNTVGTLRQKVFDTMTRQSVDYFERTRVGEVMDRFGTITSITMWLRTLTESMLASVIQLLLITVFLLWQAPWAGLVALLLLPFNLWHSWHSLKQSRPFRRGWEKMAGRLAGLLAEMITHTSTVRSLSGEPQLQQQYADTQQQWRYERDQLHRVEWKGNLLRHSVNAVAVLVVLVYVCVGASRGQFSAGDVLLVLTLLQNLLNQIQPLSRLINQTGDVEANAERLLELLNNPLESSDPELGIELTHFESLRFEQVSFHYPGNAALVLDHVSFELDAGQSLALVGPSGTGKTTIFKLVLGFYQPTGGRILVNGIDLRQVQLKSWRALLGTVLQDVALFNDTVLANIAFAKPEASEQEVCAAAELAQAAEFIQRLPLGYQTRVGERGIRLSGGEKQRLAIARALLKQPQLILLDEATSALDSQSELKVQQGLSQLCQGRTSLVIAHRLSTVVHADLILVLQNGKVAEQGHHKELLSRGELYAKLHQLQQGHAA
jgi:ABC-type multidrug transport system fused ATPase/permease subunit